VVVVVAVVAGRVDPLAGQARVGCQGGVQWVATTAAGMQGMGTQAAPGMAAEQGSIARGHSCSRLELRVIQAQAVVGRMAPSRGTRVPPPHHKGDHLLHMLEH
jgi:hypothetical protein